MDYEGQKLAELIFYWIILSFGGIGWVIGFMRQDFTVVFQAWLVGVVLSVIVSSAHEKHGCLYGKVFETLQKGLSMHTS
jgi:signal peptidase complex subunit 1